MRRHTALIINADDFGWDEDSAHTTIELFERGALTSATLMIGRPGTAIALAYAKKSQNRFSFGLHFNIVDGHIPATKTDRNSLVGPDGVFPPSNTQRLKALAFRLRSEDIQRELEGQLAVLFDYGLHVSHVDSHGHLHKFPQVITGMRSTLESFGIRCVRIPQNHFQVSRTRRRVLHTFFRSFFHGFTCTDHFFMLHHHKDASWFQTFVDGLRPGITELGIHPGQQDVWRSVETASFMDGQALQLLDERLIHRDSFLELNADQSPR